MKTLHILGVALAAVLGVTEEALGIMAGLFWDLGEMARPL